MTPEQLGGFAGVTGVPDAHHVIVPPAGQFAPVSGPLETTHLQVVILGHGHNVLCFADIVMMDGAISTATAWEVNGGVRDDLTGRYDRTLYCTFPHMPVPLQPMQVSTN